MKPNTPTLGEYFETTFAPAKLTGRSVNMIYQYRTALNALCQYTGRNLTLGAVTEKMLDGFEEHLRSTGRDSNAGKFRRHCAAIMRMAKPGRFNRRPAGGPRKPNPAMEEGTLWHFYHTVYRRMKMAGAAPGTEESYLAAIRDFYRYLERAAMLDDLTDENVAGLMAELLEKGRSRSTCNNRRTHLLALWRFARKRKLVSELPDVDRFKLPKRLPKSWSMEQMGAIIAAAAQEPGEVPVPGGVGTIPLGLFFEALIRVAFETALRVSSLLSIRWKAVDLQDGFISVAAEATKNRQEGLFKVTADTLEALRAIRLPRRDLFFPWPYDAWGRQWPVLNRHLHAILCGAGIEHDHTTMWHQFRRSCAAWLAVTAGAEIASRHLQHSTIRLTLENYIDPRRLPKVHAADLLPKLVVPQRRGGGA